MPINHQYQCGRIGEQNRKGGYLNEAVPYFASTVSGLQAHNACIWEKGERNAIKTQTRRKLDRLFPYASYAGRLHSPMLWADDFLL